MIVDTSKCVLPLQLYDPPPLPDERLDRQELAQVIFDILMEMGPRSSEVIRRFYGLDGQEPESCSAMAREWGLSRGRVSSLKREAEACIRWRGWWKLLEDFL